MIWGFRCEEYESRPFRVIVKTVVVIPYRHCEANYESQLQGSIEDGTGTNRSRLHMGPISCPETSVKNCHSSMHNNPEKRRFWRASRIWTTVLIHYLEQQSFQIRMAEENFYTSN
jgi:hypothetical protein